MSELTLKKPIGMLAALTCAAIALSAIAGIALSLLGASTLWFFLGFEVVTLAACIFGTLLAMGRYSDGPAIGLLCVLGTVAVSAILGDVSTQLSNPIGGPILRTFGQGGLVQIPVTTFLALRLVGATLIGICAAWTVLQRRPSESLRSLAVGLGLCIAMLVIIAIGWKARAPLAAFGSFASTIVFFLVGVLALGLLAASIHYTLRAFEFGRLGRHV